MTAIDDYTALPPSETLDDTIPIGDEYEAHTAAASEDIGQCATCGKPTYRPPGATPTGRRKRIPKHCTDCGGQPASGKGETRVRKPNLAQGIEDFHNTLGGVCLMRGDLELAAVFMGPEKVQAILSGEHPQDFEGIAKPAGRAWANIASNVPAVNKGWQAVLTTSMWGDLVSVYAPALMVVGKRKPARFSFVTRMFKRGRRKTAPDPSSNGRAS